MHKFSTIELINKFNANTKFPSIYCFILNNKKYIGNARTTKRRLGEHCTDLKYNKHINQFFQNAFNKYGLENLQIELLEVWDTEVNREELLNREKYWIEFYNTANKQFGYNIISDPTSGLVGVPRSPEVKSKISEAIKNSDYHKSGKVSENGKKMKEEKMGIFSEESRKKSIEAIRRRAMNGELSGINNPFYGKKHSKEFKEKLSKERKGKNLGVDNPNYGNKWSEEQREKMSKRVKTQEFYNGCEYIIRDIKNKITYATNCLDTFISFFNLPIKKRNITKYIFL